MCMDFFAILFDTYNTYVHTKRTTELFMYNTQPFTIRSLNNRQKILNKKYHVYNMHLSEILADKFYII